jgi:hypothetical protein
MTSLFLSAHGRCGLQEAEALVLEWFETEGLELVHCQEGMLIAWGEPGWMPASPPQPLAVEVAFYTLEGGWVQARWNLRLEEGAACPSWAVELFDGLSLLLRQEPHWQIDGP